MAKYIKINEIQSVLSRFSSPFYPPLSTTQQLCLLGSTFKPPFLLQYFHIILALPSFTPWVNIPPVLHRHFSLQQGVQGPGECRHHGPGHTSCILPSHRACRAGTALWALSGPLGFVPSGNCLGKGVGNTSPASQYHCLCLFIPFVGDLATSY